MLRVQSGTRLVLTYNLAYIAAGTTPVASNLNNPQLRATQMLAPWRQWYDYWRKEKQDQSWDLAIDIFNHKYTDASLKMDHLKGTDRARAQCLEAACKAHNFTFFLANLEASREGSCDDEDSWATYHELVEVSDSEQTLRALFHANGKKFATEITVEEDDFLDEELFSGEPDKEDYSGWTGNEGVIATHFYRKSCMVVMPKEHGGRFLRDAAGQGKVDATAWFGKYLDDCRDNPEDEKLRDQLSRTCDSILQASKEYEGDKTLAEQFSKSLYRGCSPDWSPRDVHRFPDTVIGLVAEAALLMKDEVSFKLAAPHVKDTLPMTIFYELGKKISEAGLDSWRESYVNSACFTDGTINNSYFRQTSLRHEKHQVFASGPCSS